MKERVREVLYRNTSCEYDFPTNQKEFIEWWKEKFAEAPDEFKNEVQIKFEVSSFYDSYSLDVEIFYYRIETDEEEALRKKREQQRKEFKENQELCELERLRNKYGL